MLTYRLIQNDLDFADLVWRHEEAMPAWYRDFSHVWTPDRDSFLSLWRDCQEIYGLFDGDNLLACVYIEFQGESSTNIHISVIAKVNETALVNFFKSVKRKKILEGVTVITGWIAAKNRPMLRLGEAAGFRRTGLRMGYGCSRGRVIEWLQVRA